MSRIARTIRRNKRRRAAAKLNREKNDLAMEKEEKAGERILPEISQD